MATCIKSLLLAALKTDIASISSIKEVSLNPNYMPKGDDPRSDLPFSVLVDYPERPIEGNRLRKSVFELHIYVFVHSDLVENLSPDMDDIHAKIYQVMTDTASTYFEYCQGRKEISHNKDYLDETTGQIEDVWELTYAHARTDPYTQNPT